MSPENEQGRREFLKKCAFSSMLATFAILGLIYSYVFGIDLLTRIIPSIPKPHPLSFGRGFFSTFDTTTSIFCLIGSICFIYLSLRDVIAGKHHYNIRSEFVLIGNSFVVIGLNLQYLADNIQPTGSINEILYSMSLLLILTTAITLIVAFLDKYTREKKKKENLTIFSSQTP